MADQPPGNPEGSDTTAVDETRPAEAETPKSSVYLHFRGPNNAKSPLLGYQPFILYWNPKDSRDFYPVGLWNNTDMSPKSEVSKSEVLVFRFKTNNGEHLTAADLSPQGGPIGLPPISFEWVKGASAAWKLPSQRKGQDYYISAVQGSPYEMRGVRTCTGYADGIRFALWMDIAAKGGSWISDQDNTGSIRMQAETERRAYLVAVRYGTNDPFGSQTTFRKRTWSDLIG